MASSSGKMNQPPGGSGACNGTAIADIPNVNVEQEMYDYQMHTKMCKKIAQLTKMKDCHRETIVAISVILNRWSYMSYKTCIVAYESIGVIIVQSTCMSYPSLTDPCRTV
ncbi:hypothetical protein DPX16_5613 [Anabarilius grahami]|uniref:Uncharacterized protein n=1 Tax=Anabarilius grahami TaxID=495550 RepID=A0A3N0YB66_ANAGA|nr:hypothetical protein DPX16_5613 [Anabarilius grahami]